MPSVEQRLSAAESLIETKGWLRRNIDAPPFVLRAYLKGSSPEGQVSAQRTLTVYIEGDGYAWRTRSSPSSNPTPIDPVALRLALQHPDGPVAYLARPCQFVGSEAYSGCEEDFWTSRRFARDVVDSSSFAISVLMNEVGATSVQLIGYSGGGAVAALVAAKRDDVVQLVTVAGNLDHATWTESHSVTPLSGSLNPIDYVEQLLRVSQVHLVGGDDEIVPPVIAETYQQSFPEDQKPFVKILPEYTHRCCWVDDWPEILKLLTAEQSKESQ